MEGQTGVKVNARRVGPTWISATLPPIRYLVGTQTKSVVIHACIGVALSNPFWTNGTAHADSSASIAWCIVLQIRMAGRRVGICTVRRVAVCGTCLHHP
jgi:hypothetical protein